MIEMKIVTSYGFVQILSLGKGELESNYSSKSEELRSDSNQWVSFTQESLHKAIHKRSPDNPIPLKNVVSLNQVHGTSVLDGWDVSQSYLSSHTEMIPMSGDGLWTNQEGIALGIRTADCIPLFIWSYVKPMVAVLHIGWKGAQLGILEDFLERITGSVDRYGFYIGPCIRGKDYEVGEDVAKYFVKFKGVLEPKRNPSTLKSKPNPTESKYLLNLPLHVHETIRNWDKDALVMDCMENTFQSIDWYSHRSGEFGRNLHGIRILALS